MVPVEGSRTSIAGSRIPSRGGLSMTTTILAAKRPAMTRADPTAPEEYPVAANDNGDAAGSDPEATRVNDVVLQLARLIGRRMVRQDFPARIAASNDNVPKSGDGRTAKPRREISRAARRP